MLAEGLILAEGLRLADGLGLTLGETDGETEGLTDDDPTAAAFSSIAAIHQVLLPESVPLIVSLPPVAALSPTQ
jgi:hypothetical protein